MNGVQNIIGGLLVFGFSFVPTRSPIRSWQALFMSYGIWPCSGQFFFSFGCLTLSWEPSAGPRRISAWWLSVWDTTRTVFRIGASRLNKWKTLLLIRSVRRRIYSDIAIAISYNFFLSICFRTYPALDHDSVRWHRCLCQHHRQLLRLQHLGEPAAVDGHWSGHNNHNDILCILGSLLSPNDHHHDSITNPFNSCNFHSSRNSILTKQKSGHADRVLYLLLLLRRLCTVLEPGITECGRSEKKVGRHRLQLCLLGSWECHRASDLPW